MNKNLKFSICIPTYNGATLINQTLKSILSQSFQNFEIIISDDCSTDNTIDVIKKFKDKRIKIYQNKINFGYGRNLQVLKKLAKTDVLFLMGQDDVLLKNALLKTYQAFLLGKEIGAVTRPYYWFDINYKIPVRAVFPYDKNQDRVVSVFNGERELRKIFESVGQLSGLAYRTKYLDTDFHQHTFPAHIYPFASITKKHKVVFLKDFTVAVRISSSQSRFKSSIYDISPTESWIKMANSVYRGQKYQKVCQQLIKFITTSNFVGLVQIKNYSTFANLLKEIVILVKYRWQNLFNPGFWFFAFGTIIIPRKLLIWLVDNYKNKILAKKLAYLTGML